MILTEVLSPINILLTMMYSITATLVVFYLVYFMAKRSACKQEIVYMNRDSGVILYYALRKVVTDDIANNRKNTTCLLNSKLHILPRDLNYIWTCDEKNFEMIRDVVYEVSNRDDTLIAMTVRRTTSYSPYKAFIVECHPRNLPENVRKYIIINKE